MYSDALVTVYEITFCRKEEDANLNFYSHGNFEYRINWSVSELNAEGIMELTEWK
jgi:hypothetical protein